MARPKRLRVDWNRYTSPPQPEGEVFKAGAIRVVLRLFVWLWAAVRFFVPTVVLVILRRDSPRRRAERLRHILETTGATFIKIGQQLAMRIDLLPYAYAHELEKMLDSVPSFPTEQAIEMVEAAAGKPLDEVFTAFDPVPIASASIACVYQGILKNGQSVAVKVRRPGIGELFAADLRGLTWLLWLLEQIVLPPRFSKNVTYDLQSMLMDELDFSSEARYMELFKARADKVNLHASAPHVYFGLSDQRVLVMEFVTGIFLSELLAAVENQDARALAEIRRQNIDPSIVAKRLLRVNRYGGFEAIVFHADLHPGNVLVQPNNELMLIDFGSVGAFTERERVIWRRLLYAQSNEDVGGMVQAAMALLEPLPPVDIDSFTKRMEEIFWRDLLALKSEHSPWWERTTANVWLGVLRLTRLYNVPTSMNMLRMIRVNLLADTIALRLDKTIDHYAEYQKYLKGAGRRARKRVRRRLTNLFADREFMEWEQVLQAVPAATYRIQRILDSPLFNYARLESKTSFGFIVFARAAFLIVVATAAAVGGVVAYQQLVVGVDRVDTVAVLRQQVLTSGWYLTFVLLVLYSSTRRLMYRLRARQTA